jgi:PAS domain S-box-containing protein
MNIDFSGLLKLYKELSGASFCYILKTESADKIIASSDKLTPKISDLTNKFNIEFGETSFNNDKISKLKATNELNSLFKTKSIVALPITSVDSSTFYLVELNNGNIKDSNKPHLKTIINSLKSEIVLNYEPHEKLEFILSKIDAVVYSYSFQNNTYNFISNSVENILGLTKAEIKGSHSAILKRMSKEYIHEYKTFIKKVKLGEPAFVDYEYKTKLGKNLFLHQVAEPIDDNSNSGLVVGVISNITREKEIIRKLEKSEEQFELLINTAIDFIYTLNGFGYLVQVNENGANALGYTSEEMLGKHFLDFASDYQKSEISKSFQDMLSSRSTIHFEIDLLHKLNKSITYEFLATPLLEGDEITGVLGIGRDVTQRRKNEESIKNLNLKLKETKRLVEIGRERAKQQITILEEINFLKNEFISNVSHELRTPLASIVGFSETLASDEVLSNELVTEFSNIILTEGKRLARFIDDILDFSELESGASNLQKEEFNVIEMLKQIANKVDMEFKTQNISFTSIIPDNEITIMADREKLIKAFLTIFENTSRFTKSGDNVSFVVQDFLKEVEIVITDDGNGISETELELLFDKFHSAGSTNEATPTAGIALSIVKHIFEHHKGLLQVKSRLGEGTSFIIRLPKKEIKV